MCAHFVERVYCQNNVQQINFTQFSGGSIYIVKFRTRPPVEFSSFSCSFSGNFDQIIGGLSPFGLAPLPGNPRFAAAITVPSDRIQSTEIAKCFSEIIFKDTKSSTLFFFFN